MSAVSLETPVVPRRRRSDEELKALVEEFNARLAARLVADPGDEPTADEVAAWAAEHFTGSLAVACSMADAVLPHVVAKHAPGVDVLFLDTGYHFSTPSSLVTSSPRTCRSTSSTSRPSRPLPSRTRSTGRASTSATPPCAASCARSAPLARTLPLYEAWVTGVRRDEAPTRTDTPFVTWDEKNGLVKINPLASWTFDELQAYAVDNNVEVNSLLSDGFLSIGCEPCTRRVEPGEDPRAGRWAGFTKTECGLHT